MPRKELLMDTTRRGFLSSTVAATGAAAARDLAHAADDEHNPARKIVRLTR
jgi:hypothetical protein